MRKHPLVLAAVLLSALFVTTDARAQEVGPPAPSAEQGDKAMFYRLQRQIRRIDRESDEMMERAMTEARNNGGKADAETKARLLSLRDERDRVLARMLILSMRYGWPIPEVDEPAVTKSSRQEAEDSIFGSIDILVQRQFASEARTLAAKIRMPLVSLESMQIQ